MGKNWRFREGKAWVPRFEDRLPPRHQFGEWAPAPECPRVKLTNATMKRWNLKKGGHSHHESESSEEEVRVHSQGVKSRGIMCEKSEGSQLSGNSE